MQKDKQDAEKTGRSSSLERLVLLNVSIGTFMATFDGSVVNVALPTIGGQLRANVVHLQWVVTAYLVTIASLLLLFGRLSDIVGRKRIYSTGFVVFTISSGLCGISQDLWQLVAFRIIQGVGASMMMANALAIIARVYPDEKRGKALGISGMVVSMGVMTGPALGGLLVGVLGWRSIFWINVPLGIVGSYLSFKYLPPPKNVSREKLDWIGALIFAVGLNSLLFLSIYLPRSGWETKTLALLLGAPVAFILFHLWEKKFKYPLIDTQMTKNRIFTMGIISRMLVFFAEYPVIFLLPFYLQLVKGFTPEKIGLIMIFFPIAMGIFSPFSGRLSDRFLQKWPMIAGLLVLITGLAVLVRLNATSGLLPVCTGLFLVGTGMGIFQAPNNSLIMGNTPVDRLSIANALISVMRNIGTILGVAMSVFIFSIYGVEGGISFGEASNPGTFSKTIVSVINTTLSISITVLVLTILLTVWGLRQLPKRYK